MIIYEIDQAKLDEVQRIVDSEMPNEEIDAGELVYVEAHQLRCDDHQEYQRHLDESDAQELANYLMGPYC